MKDTNQLVLIGRLAKDPELRTLESGNKVCRIVLAWTTSRKVDGEYKDQSNYIDFDVWGKAAESAAEYLSKGRQVCVSGHLEQQTWDGNDGEKKYKHSIQWANIQYLSDGSGKKDGGNQASLLDGDTTEAPAAPTTQDDDIPF